MTHSGSKSLAKVAYKGESFTVEWYSDWRESSQALAYHLSLSEERQLAALLLFRRIGDSGKIFDLTKFRSEGDKIFAFKPQPDRYLFFFFAGRKIIITNAFEKRTQKMPPNEKERAIRAKADYERRVKLRIYYGNQE